MPSDPQAAQQMLAAFQAWVAEVGSAKAFELEFGLAPGAYRDRADNPPQAEIA